MAYNVLHVIPAIADRYGGPSAATLGICRALLKAGTKSLVATTDADGHGKLPVSTANVTTYRGVPAIFFPRQLSESFKWSAPLAEWLHTHVREFDLVHVHAVFSHSSIAAGRACRAARVPYLVRPLGTLDPWSLDRHPRRKRLLMALGVRRLLSGAAAIHYTAPEEQRLAEERLSWLPRGVVASLGIDDELFAKSPQPRPAREPIVVSMGRLDPKKGIDVLIEAFHSATGTGQLGDWRLVIAGTGTPDYAAALERLALAGPASSRIEFRGWVNGTARAELLETARLFVLPSQQENFGIALVEAMACGLPAVVSPGVNLAAEIEAADAGWVTAPTIAKVTETLRAVMTKPAELNRRGELARQFAGRFRWTTVASALLSIYDDVLRGRASVVQPELRSARPA